MSRVLVDSCVILDVLTVDPTWGAWSEQALERCASQHDLAINAIIYAEISVYFARIEELNLALEDFERLPLPFEAGFLAGKCFLEYRKRGGQKRSPMPDFYVGAHAAVEDMALLTRDRSRYATYFPKLALIAP